jgi:hypothetical protein
MRKMMLLAGSIIPVCCSSGSIGHAASPSTIGVALTRIARACRVHRASKGAGCTAAHRQKPYSDSSRRWAFDMFQSFCAAGIPENRVDSTAPAC